MKDKLDKFDSQVFLSLELVVWLTYEVHAFAAAMVIHQTCSAYVTPSPCFNNTKTCTTCCLHYKKIQVVQKIIKRLTDCTK